MTGSCEHDNVPSSCTMKGGEFLTSRHAASGEQPRSTYQWVTLTVTTVDIMGTCDNVFGNLPLCSSYHQRVTGFTDKFTFLSGWRVTQIAYHKTTMRSRVENCCISSLLQELRKHSLYKRQTGNVIMSCTTFHDCENCWKLTANDIEDIRNITLGTYGSTPSSNTYTGSVEQRLTKQQLTHNPRSNI